jgi:hypothetical protein
MSSTRHQFFPSSEQLKAAYEKMVDWLFWILL